MVTTRMVVSLLLLGSPVAAVAVDPPLVVSAPSEQTLIAARDMLAAMYPVPERQKMFATVQNAMMANMISGFKSGLAVKPGCQCDRMIDRVVATITSDAREHPIDMNSLFEAYARAYARNFSVSEMHSISDFVRTPVGIRFIQRGQAMVSDPDVSRWLTEQTAVSIRRLQPKLADLRTEIAASGAGANEP